MHKHQLRKPLGVEVGEVFTPRNPTVNPGMYIHRGEHELNLKRSVLGSMHSFLFGESGTGKSWLYKSVLKNHDINFVVVNCSNASRKNSITEEIFSVCVPSGLSQQTSYQETYEAGVAFGLGAKKSTQEQYIVKQDDKLLSSFQALYEKSGGKKSIIVFDNLEVILAKKELMDEMAEVIILLDDERFAQYRVKFLIVGVPNLVIHYFSQTQNSSSVGNRIEEVCKLVSFEKPQVSEFVKKGFNEQLKLDCPPRILAAITDRVFNVTLGVPQRVHEYCECIGYELEDNNWVYDYKETLENADMRWLKKGLRESYAVIETHLNSSSTNDARRNQIIYTLGKRAIHEIDTASVTEGFKKEFPTVQVTSASGIGKALNHLAGGDTPLLNKVSNSKAFYIADPRYLMCIRIMLAKDTEGNVKKKKFKM